MLNLDTHIVVDLLENRLKSAEEEVIRGETWAISDMVLWEIAKLNQLGRIELDMNDADFLAFVDNCRIIPIDSAIALQSTRLDFRSDPADEIIAATSIVHGFPLLTRDLAIRKSKLVPLA
jgi:PIN domain nuclease of toxin-antitoxin system